MSPIKLSIDKLTDKELLTVVRELTDIARADVSRAYTDDSVPTADLAALTNAEAHAVMCRILPILNPNDQTLEPTDLRKLLLFFAEQPELEPYLRQALNRRMLVSISVEPMLVSALIVFILSINWKFKLKKSKDGKLEYEVDVQKAATPVSVLQNLINRSPGLGQGGGAKGSAS
jgi:hypothetical protein